MRALKQQQLHSVWLGLSVLKRRISIEIYGSHTISNSSKETCVELLLLLLILVCYLVRLFYLGSEVHLEVKCLECSLDVADAFDPILLCNSFKSALYSIQVIVILYYFIYGSY